MPLSVVLPAGTPDLTRSGVTVLHRYPDGSRLVELADGRPVPAGAIVSGTGSPPAPEAGAPAPEAGAEPGADSPGEPARAPGPVTAVVELVAAADPRWLRGLRESGLTVLAYQPVNGYLCLGDPAAYESAAREVLTSEGRPAVRAVTALTPDRKPSLSLLRENGETVVVVLAAGEQDRAALLAEIEALPGLDLLPGAGNDDLDSHRFRIRARIGEEAHAALVRMPRVLSVEAWSPPVPEDELAGLILAGRYDPAAPHPGSYTDWLADHDVDGSDCTIGIVDGGVDTSHPAFAGRLRDLTGGRRDWHATMVAGHAAGDYRAERDARGLAYGLGTAPGAQLLSQDKLGAASALCRETVRAAATGAAIQNNSWGKGTRDPMDYGSDEALYDALVRDADPGGAERRPLTVCFSSGNSGARGLTRPKAAKNVIVTGNSESHRPDVGGVGSDDVTQVYDGPHGSSRGNCGDGRIRPHLVAPGEWTASANVDCVEGEDEYVSPLITWGGGSSGASPKTAGACALLVHWWRNTRGGVPSPAMLRALLVNGAEPITTGGPPPNTWQGWGRLCVENVLDPGVPRIHVDQTVVLSAAGQAREWPIRVADPTRPLKVTLAWTDPPGPVGSGGRPDSSPLVNRLALRVEVGGEVYRGVQDRFRGGFSTRDSALTPPLLPEGHDNLQNVFLPPGAATGPVRVTVQALDITTDCLDLGFDSPRQDFALVVSNARLDTAAAPSTVVVGVDSDVDGPGPGHPDGYWSPSAGGDTTLRSARAVTPPAREPAARPSEGPATEEDPWWARPIKTEAGSHPGVAGPATGGLAPPVGPAVEAGRRLLEAAGRDLRVAAPADAGGPAARPGGGLTAVVQAALEHGRAVAGDDPAASWRSVVVVGAGTRCTTDDVLGLRALAARGGLHLVAADTGVLEFLAQRIGPRADVQYRLADTRTQVSDLLLDTLAEAGGLQPVVLTVPQRTADGAWERRADIVADDRLVVVQRDATSPGAGRLSVVRASGEELVYRSGAGTGREERATHAVEVTQPGPWTLREEGGSSSAAAGLRAWALGGPALRVSGSEVPGPHAEVERRFVRVEAADGGALRQVSLPAARLPAGPGADSEARRAVVWRARRSRLDAGGEPVAEHERGAVPTPALGGVVELPRAEGRARVLDLPMTVAGTDAEGRPYTRHVRAGSVHVVPWSRWAGGADHQGPDRRLRTRARVAGQVHRDGAVVSLEVARGPHTRHLTVPGGLARRLSRAGLPRGGEVVVEVAGSRLLSLYRPLADPPGPPRTGLRAAAAARGVELRGAESRDD